MLLRGPASVATTIIIAQLALAVLTSVNMSEKYSNTAGGVQHKPAQQITTRGRTYTNMSMHKILKRVCKLFRRSAVALCPSEVYEPEVHFHKSRVDRRNCPINNPNS